MKRRTINATWGLLCLITLTGCWDSQYLTHKKIVNGISLDAANGNRLLGAVRAVTLESKGGGQFDVKDEIVHAVGDSTNEVGMKIDNMLPGTLEASKVHVIIIGEELARKGMLPALESFYRNPKGYLKSNVLIGRGKGFDILAFKKIENNPIAFGIKQIFEGSVSKTIVPEQTLYSLWNEMTDPGQDTVMPMIRKMNDKAVIVDGVGLMSGGHYSGVSLPEEESTLLLLLMGKLGKFAAMETDSDANVVSFRVVKIKRSMDLSVDDRTSKIECAINLDLYGFIASDPNSLSEAVDRERIKNKIAASLNKQAVAVVSKLLQANCDALGVGRKLSVSRPGLWKKIDWQNGYKDVALKPNVRIHLTGTGIIS
ncbi:Ger(x)C family spore germination protein [Paenibacillus sp. MWE-103]|uniref:Ger(X)C family spore germination protein n=1 Tax=Paenibacillus artemisiicola TaxID=1172618 RepID=A0ABS3WC27_9BACL|nr:Ger(x)C family spore germination protein [Paenibacillus artemisiicola]MBO7745828.1 Ger(x)C family spore germination protein [Paenibacillus artemisiicola]